MADTLCVLCADFIYILAGKKKIQFLQPLVAALEKREDLPSMQMTVKIKVGHVTRGKVRRLWSCDEGKVGFNV